MIHHTCRMAALQPAAAEKAEQDINKDIKRQITKRRKKRLSRSSFSFFLAAVRTCVLHIRVPGPSNGADPCDAATRSRLGYVSRGFEIEEVPR